MGDFRPDPALGDWSAGELEQTCSRGEFGECKIYETAYDKENSELLGLRLEVYERIVVSQFEVMDDLDNPDQADSFYETSFNLPVFRPAGSKWLTFTWGLRDGSEGHGGGTWPTAVHGNDPNCLPKTEGYAPLLVKNGSSAMAVSPLNYFLISPLSTQIGDDGARVARGLHGAVPGLGEGRTVKTIFVFGDGMVHTLEDWGRAMRKYEDKELPAPEGDLLLENLGHWNAYGSYYSELFNGYDRETLVELGDYFDEEEIPIGYFGVDLWYDYEEVGKAKDYTPNEDKFPEGLEPLSRKTGRPLVLHLSALDKEKYSAINSLTIPPDYGSIYPDIAERIDHEGGICAWHDWLRSEQSVWKRLRGNLDRPGEWFKAIAESFSDRGISVMLCMETVGMLMESVKYQNIRYCRNSTDYLFKQKGQLAQLWSRGRKEFDYQQPRNYIEQQVLVGGLMNSLGLYPFNDLFISNGNHPEGFSAEDPDREALLSILSAGPVGLGDKLGEIDTGVVNKLVFPDGKLARPDRGYRPREGTIGERCLAFSAKSERSGLTWEYYCVANVSDWPLFYEFDFPHGEGRALFDYQEREMVPRPKGDLGPAEINYYVSLPVLRGLGLIGFLDKYITAPSRKITEVGVEGNQISLEFELTVGETFRFAVAKEENKGSALNVGGHGFKLLEIQRKPPQVVIAFESTERKVDLRLIY